MISIPKTIVGLIGFIVAYLSLSVKNEWFIFYPETFPDPFVMSSSPAGLPATCGAHKHVRTMEGVHTFAEVQSIMNKGFFGSGWEPILFKKFLTDSDKKWDYIMSQHENTSLLFTSVVRKSFGNVFMRGITIGDSVNSTLRDVFELSRALDIGNDNNASLFASFLPFLNEKTTKELFNMEGDNYQSIKLDTNFVSYFKEDTLASSIHAAFPVNSYALQLTGRKLWILNPPSDYHQFRTLTVGPTIVHNGNEKEMVERTGHYIVAIQEEGDMFFFPPHWPHAVISKAGVNVMCNIRQPSLLKSFFIAPRVFFDGVLCALLHSKRAKSFNLAKVEGPQEKVIGFNNVNRPKPESPCKDTWYEMLRR